MVKTMTLPLYDLHFTFIFSKGGAGGENELTLRAIDLKTAKIKLKTENFGSGDEFQIQYKVEDRWGLLASIKGSGTKEIDVTSKLLPLEDLAYRYVVWLQNPVLYWSCFDAKADLYLEYEPITGEPESTPYTGDVYFGEKGLAGMGEMMRLMMMFMFMFMMMSMMTAMMGAMAPPRS